VKVVGQLGMDERIVEDEEVEAALEERENRRNSYRELQRRYAEADTKAKGLVEALGLAPGEVIRIGRFRIEKRAIAGKSVTFETKPTSRISVKADEE
jgi:hypothetical protein